MAAERRITSSCMSWGKSLRAPAPCLCYHLMRGLESNGRGPHKPQIRWRKADAGKLTSTDRPCPIQPLTQGIPRMSSNPLIPAFAGQHARSLETLLRKEWLIGWPSSSQREPLQLFGRGATLIE